MDRKFCTHRQLAALDTLKWTAYLVQYTNWGLDAVAHQHLLRTEDYTYSCVRLRESSAPEVSESSCLQASSAVRDDTP